MIAFDDATLAQIRAADPAKSTWVSANAGSGKTRVLTDRVARLLLHGTDPQKILCLTYTKAAAAEMQIRLFQRLGEWAMMEESDLRDALLKLGEPKEVLTDDKLRLARTLFASALETPGGLKIQTIHSFCDALLRRFPVESGVSPQFEMMNDRQKAQICADILENMASGEFQNVFDEFAQFFTGADSDELLAEIVKNRDDFNRKPKPHDFGLSGDETLEMISAAVFTDQNRAILSKLAELMESGGVTDIKNAPTILAALSTSDTNNALQKLESVLLTGAGAKTTGPFSAKIDKVPGQAALKKGDPFRNEINDLMRMVEAVRDQRLSLLSFQRTKALHRFAGIFLEQFDAYKMQTGLLDYDDLINRARQLLTQSSMASWVLYRLDGGIDHILVDEAQDTSAQQWDVVQQLHAEFTSGESANDAQRTLFIVGDEKQSIYSFQGADPRIFGDIKNHFSTQLAQVNNPLASQDLLYSFRSAAPIMRLVDNVFQNLPENRFQNDVQHIAFKSEMAGRIDLWPVIEKGEKPAENPWYQPNNSPAPDDPRILLARQIADEISTIIKSGQLIEVDNKIRPVKAGDFLILVRSRGALFKAIIKELKSAMVPVAGADRFEVGAELAVQDIMSLLKFAATAEDDLSLAESLRSPIIGISEGELFSLAHGRKGYLWQELRTKSDQFANAHKIVSDIRNKADFERPYDLIERILIDHNGRQNLIARLGPEAEDGIDELLYQAMQYEQTEAPTLTGFLHWFASDEMQIKRQMDSAGNTVRVMTVHGAKGLEAPIVILPDTAQEKQRDRNQLITLENGLISWKTLSNDANKAQMAASQTQKSLDTRERMRLLYVALTRAESWLIICGAGDLGKSGETWYELISSGMEHMPVETIAHPVLGDIKSVCNEAWHGVGTADENSDDQQIDPPIWAKTTAKKLPRPAQPISPSSLPGAKALSGENDGLSVEQAMERGTQIHLLLEHLPRVPRGEQFAFGENLLRTRYDDLHEREITKLCQEAIAVTSAQELEFLFAPNSLAEVNITAPLMGAHGLIMDGIIDRLVVTPEKLWVIDYKTNAIVPAHPEQTPAGILAQMGAYLVAIKQIYPQHEIELAILWTRNAKLMNLHHDIVMNALNDAQHLDPVGTRS
ncbi:double-strand break repair helicase AddA [Amylibacter kogurei]|uniref:DNA 3'-5' helicase n=1 Tax=Paramylibacter kogurei TaxID=1889778 RepID=A0A2G5KCE6_9RHOB|nr:double-strand break repair helicase AddA [Amylibacter kogurei]PIB26520.1 double-strand break repair helicase AddA [Amylibacter kogurei]